MSFERACSSQQSKPWAFRRASSSLGCSKLPMGLAYTCSSDGSPLEEENMHTTFSGLRGNVEATK
jgi:hypothetical protein